MNYRYGIGQIDRLDFLEKLNRTLAAARTRNVAVGWCVGLAYLVIGVWYWPEWLKQWPFLQLALVCWIGFAIGPGVLAVFGLFNRFFSDWPRCPACGKAIAKRNPVLETRRCPHCHALILSDASVLRPGYELPPMTVIPSPERVRMGTSYGRDYVESLRTVVALPIIVLLWGLSGISRSMELQTMLERMIFLMGGSLLVVTGITPLIPLDWIVEILKLLRIYPREKSAFCPECGNIPNPGGVRLTGRCTECGVPLLELPSEPDIPEVLDWHKLRAYFRWDVSVIFWMVPLYMLGIWAAVQKSFWLISPVVLGILLHAVIAARLKCRAVPKKCPHCQASLNNSAFLLLWYGRCPVCRRKLVRDDDAGKGAGK